MLVRRNRNYNNHEKEIARNNSNKEEGGKMYICMHLCMQCMTQVKREEAL